MAKKDFSAMNIGRVSAAIETATSNRGRQTTASKEEQAQRAAERRTQGRKGCKLDGQRINLLLTPENHEFIKQVSKVSGLSMTAYINTVIEAYRKEHPELMKKAAEFIDLVNKTSSKN